MHLCDWDFVSYHCLLLRCQCNLFSPHKKIDVCCESMKTVSFAWVSSWMLESWQPCCIFYPLTLSAFLHFQNFHNLIWFLSCFPHGDRKYIWYFWYCDYSRSIHLYLCVSVSLSSYFFVCLSIHLSIQYTIKCFYVPVILTLVESSLVRYISLNFNAFFSGCLLRSVSISGST